MTGYFHAALGLRRQYWRGAETPYYVDRDVSYFRNEA